MIRLWSGVETSAPMAYGAEMQTAIVETELYLAKATKIMTAEEMVAVVMMVSANPQDEHEKNGF